MKFRFGTAVGLAAFCAGAFLVQPVVAQTSLEQNVAGQLAEHNIKVENLSSLSNAQLAEIQLMLNTTEGSDATKRAMIAALAKEHGPCEGNPQLRQQVAGQLKEHRIVTPDIAKISGTQLVVIKTVLDSPYSDADKKAQIERIFTPKSGIKGDGYLRADADQCVKMVGADVDVTKLSPDQLLQIQAVAGGDETPARKAQMMEKIAQ